MTTDLISSPTTTHDVLVIGGGPAGLQAALTLGRIHRDVLLVDSGDYRNARADHLHNLIAHDGRPPADLRKAARHDLAAYDTVTILDDRVESLEQDGANYTGLTASGRTLRGRSVLLATGLRDTLPDVPGLADLFGTLVAHCPFCHGHEYAGGRVAVLGAGPGAAHVGALMSPVASEVVILTDGQRPDPATAEQLAQRHLTVVDQPVSGVRAAGAGAEVSLADGSSLAVSGVFVTTTLTQSAPFAEQLGLELLDSGCIAIDEFGRTSREGVFAAGDLAHLRALPMPLASVASAIAAGQVAASAAAMRLMD